MLFVDVYFSLRHFSCSYSLSFFPTLHAGRIHSGNSCCNTSWTRMRKKVTQRTRRTKCLSWMKGKYHWERKKRDDRDTKNFQRKMKGKSHGLGRKRRQKEWNKRNRRERETNLFWLLLPPRLLFVDFSLSAECIRIAVCFLCHKLNQNHTQLEHYLYARYSSPLDEQETVPRNLCVCDSWWWLLMGTKFTKWRREMWGRIRKRERERKQGK